MIDASDELGDVVQAGGYIRTIVADVTVDGDRVLQDFQLASAEVTSNGNAKVRTQGTAVFHYSDELGRSIVPSKLTSWLTPYATYLNVYFRITAGPFDEKVLLGTLKVVKVSDPKDARVRTGGRIISIGSSVGLQLADAFAVTDKEKFPLPASPSQLTSTWAEIAAVTGLPVEQNVADAAITRSITYQESVLDATFDLAQLLDGIPYVNSNGRVAIQPNAWPDPVVELTIGPEGNIVEVQPDDLTDEGIYNQVVVRSYGTDQVKVLATAELTDGPLRYGGPFGKVPFFASSPYVITDGQAAAYAESMLPLVSSIPAGVFAIDCLPDPRLEAGDVVDFWYNDATRTGRILERRIADSGPMSLKVQVQS